MTPVLSSWLSRNYNTRKASGYDAITPRILKYASDGIVTSLTKLYNESIQRGEWPEAWKKGEWSPVYKKDDRFDIVNYCPITLYYYVQWIRSLNNC